MDALSAFFALIVLVSGAVISIRLRFFQFRHFFTALRAVLFPGKQRKSKDSLTPFQALASALGGSIGTANIAGVAGALTLGGPGAVFYMWLAALFGMAVKFAEIVLAVKYRERRGGAYLGGPMLYIEKGLKKRRGLKGVGLLLARAFAVFGLISSCVGTPLVQANTIAESGVDMLRAFSFSPAPILVKAAFGLLSALAVGLVVIGGIKRIGRVSEFIVPFMAAGYVLFSVIALVHYRSNVMPSIASIFRGAFSVRSACGGIVGFGIIRAMRVGIARGVYSNEAGVGSAPMAHAQADTTGTVCQGLYGIFEVFADTLVMCTLTALVVLSSGVLVENGASVSGTRIALAAFAGVFGERIAGVFLAVSLVLFAFTSIIGWSVYGLNCAEYLFGKRASVPYRIVFTLLTVLGALLRPGAVWKGGEMLNYLMAAPNLIALMLLLGEVKKETGYFE